MKGIDILTRESKYYTYESYAAKQMLTAFRQLGRNARIVSLEQIGLAAYLHETRLESPDWLLIFEDPYPHEKRICDLIGVPTVYWSSGSIGSTLGYALSSYAHILSVDRVYSKFCNFSFLPHAVDSSLQFPFTNERVFDTVLFADLVDCEMLLQSWRSLYCATAFEILENTINNSFQKNPLEIAMHALKAQPSGLYSISLHDLVHAVEEYLQAFHTMNIVTQFMKNSLDVFGDHQGNNWLKRIVNHIRLHSSLPYTEHFSLMQQSKIVICKPFNSADRSEPWFFAAAGCGALPLAQRTPYLADILGSECPLLYSPDEVCDKVDYFLSHPKERYAWIVFIQKNLMAQASWKNRAREILSYEDRFSCRA